MAVKFGSSAIGGIVFGGIAMGRAYMGDSLVFPALPSNTIRFKFESGVDPSYMSWIGTWVRKSAIPNVWDCHPISNSWQYLFSSLGNINGDIEIVAMNMHGVTDARGAFQGLGNLVKVSGITGMGSSLSSVVQMFGNCTNLVRVDPFYGDYIGDCSQMFENCTSLAVAPRFGITPTKTYNMFSGCSSLVNMPKMWMNSVGDASHMYYGCSSLTSIDGYDGNYSMYLSISNANYMFSGCVNVASGILDLYNVWTGSPPLGNPSHTDTFHNCGINSVSGSAELAQIPADWK